MNDTVTRDRVRGSRLGMPRSRGAASGLLLIVLGAWGAAAPFIGHQLNFAFNSSQEWTSARGWLEVLPGVVAVVGGCLLALSRNRATGMLGGWLGVAAGAWFVVGRTFAGPLGLGDVGAPVAATESQRVALELAYFYGLGALIVFLGAMALGRLSIRSVRDVRFAERPVTEPVTEDVAHVGHADRADHVEPALVARDERADVDATTRTEPTHRTWRNRRWVNAFRGDHRTAAH